MARSSYIYVIERPANSHEPGHYQIVACFTVKHECQTFMDRSGSDAAMHWSVTRYRDNPSFWSEQDQEGTDITKEFFE